MARDEFQQRARRWLSAYKQEVLGVEEDGIWLRNGKRYSHILPREQYRLNILPSFRDEFWEWFGKQRPRIHLHSDFHHLNSSQALCFNLFFPPMMGDGDELAQFSSVMGITGAPNAAASFEFQPDPTEGTCVDFSMLSRSGRRANFEIKYTESEFGSAKADAAHLEKFESIYKYRLAGRFEESFCCAAQFLESYQIARNVWHLNESAGDIAIFLFPNENTRLRRYEALIKGCALEPFRSRIRVVYLEDLVLNLFKELNPNKTAGRLHLEEFRAKYLPFVKMARQHVESVKRPN